MKIEYMIVVVLGIGMMIFLATAITEDSFGRIRLDVLWPVPVFLFVIGTAFAVFRSLYKGTVSAVQAEAQILIREYLETKPGSSYNEVYQSIRMSSLRAFLFSSLITEGFSRLVDTGEIVLKEGGYYLKGT